MSNHGKKMIAPIIISVCMIVYYSIFLFIGKLDIGTPLFIRIIFGLVGAGLIGVVVFVLVERIKEIRSGEEDDLGKY